MIRYDRFARALKTATGLRQVSAISDSFSYLLFQRLKSGVAPPFLYPCSFDIFLRSLTGIDSAHCELLSLTQMIVLSSVLPIC
jgi:hypothetical protein